MALIFVVLTRVFAVLGGASMLAYCIFMIVLSVHYDQQIGGHLKLAADANSTELAEEKLSLAIENMEKWELCNGVGDNCYTSILYRTPNEDVGYWRKNIEGTLEDLQSMTPEERADNLVESNQLIKVRETLMDVGESGDAVTQPDGISRYPNNVGYAIWGWASLLVFGAAAFVLSDGSW